MAFKFWWMSYNARSSWKERYRSFNAALITAYIGWISELMLGSRNFTAKFVIWGTLVSLPWALQLQINNMTSQYGFLATQPLKFCSQPINKSVVIHAFFYCDSPDLAHVHSYSWKHVDAPRFQWTSVRTFLRYLNYIITAEQSQFSPLLFFYRKVSS